MPSGVASSCEGFSVIQTPQGSLQIRPQVKYRTLEAEFETLVALNSRTARQSERGEGPYVYESPPLVQRRDPNPPLRPTPIVATFAYKSRTNFRRDFVLGLRTLVRDLSAMKMQLNMPAPHNFIPNSGPVRQIISSEVCQIMRQATGMIDQKPQLQLRCQKHHMLAKWPAYGVFESE